jgi:putative ubiquitin-RnfH superfamily antitoxin RatB of RatAB toxin-antitoxin module
MSTKLPDTLEILLCDARVDPPQLQIHHLSLPKGVLPTVGWALQSLKIAKDKDDPVIGRKGCYGVFGKRKDWESPIYPGDRLELYGPLQIDPKMARRKKANRDKDSLLKEKARVRASTRSAKAKPSK